VGEGSIIGGCRYIQRGPYRRIAPLPQAWVERLLALQEKPTERRRPGVPLVCSTRGG
jgi:hypothetical protein